MSLATDTDLTTATDAELDAGLTRLYLLHHDPTHDQRPEVHADIVAVLAEFGRRLDVWLVER